MPDLTIRDVPQEELDALASRAARHGRTAEAEVKHLIHDAAGEEMLVLKLERATRAVDEQLKAVEHASTAAAPPTSRRRYRVEPTPRRRG